LVVTKYVVGGVSYIPLLLCCFEGYTGWNSSQWNSQ